MHGVEDVVRGGEHTSDWTKSSSESSQSATRRRAAKAPRCADGLGIEHEMKERPRGMAWATGEIDARGGDGSKTSDTNGYLNDAGIERS
eukprot:4474943-Alexandrium_andersonii.AAC.1